VSLFVESIMQLFKSCDQDFSYDADKYLLRNEKINIQFLANGSLPQQVASMNDLNLDHSFTIRLWEDIYQQNPEVVNSRILSLLGQSERIYARNTSIKSISQTDLDSFLNVNHLNHSTKCKYKYGLLEEDKLVAVAAFGRSCPIQHGGQNYISHELIRYCSLLNHTVVGGLSKLISHFVKAHKPEHLMTYVDQEWSQGKSYLQMGFQVDSITTPKKFWIEPNNQQRIDVHSLPEHSSREELTNKGWQCVENLGNIKLVKFIS